jgi:hypothetical protein
MWVVPPFARRHAADHLRAVGERLLRVEGAGLAGHALRDDLGVPVDENAHSPFAMVPRAKPTPSWRRAPCLQPPRDEQPSSKLTAQTTLTWKVARFDLACFVEPC